MSTEKNYDPFMHSAEHILNQTMVRMFNCGRSFSNHIERRKSKCDYHFNRALTEDELAEIESTVNRVIASDAAITDYFLSRDEAAQKFDLSRLPDDAGSEIRIVAIGDYDFCPCIGPHASHSAEIGTFRIISADYADEVLRIRFKLNRE